MKNSTLTVLNITIKRVSFIQKISFEFFNKKYFLGAPLVMENGSFSWGGKEPLLFDINIRVETGELVAVVGSVGAGNNESNLILIE